MYLAKRTYLSGYIRTYHMHTIFVGCKFHDFANQLRFTKITIQEFLHA